MIAIENPCAPCVLLSVPCGGFFSPQRTQGSIQGSQGKAG